MAKKMICEGEHPREGERPREGEGPRVREGEGPRVREGERPREPFPVRHHPSMNSVRTIGFRSTILFVTVCTEGRKSILACRDMASIIVSAWADADNWIVGLYVIMPDHVHFFCSPATCPPCDFHKWIMYWKRLATQMAARVDARPPVDAARVDARPPVDAARVDARPPRDAARGYARPPRDAHPPRLWQSGCWDVQIRTGIQYKEKWEYVRNNPVRRGLVVNADDWPYQGRMNVLEWHERM